MRRDAAVPTRIANAYLLAILRQIAIPEIGDLLISGEGKGKHPVLNGCRAGIGEHQVYREAASPLAGKLITNLAAHAGLCRCGCWFRLW